MICIHSVLLMMDLDFSETNGCLRMNSIQYFTYVL